MSALQNPPQANRAFPVDANDIPLVQQYIGLMKAEGIEIAGIEFVEDQEGNRYTYDINGTTNYSGVLGEKIRIDGMREFARWIRREVVPRTGGSKSLLKQTSDAWCALFQLGRRGA